MVTTDPIAIGEQEKMEGFGLSVETFTQNDAPRIGHEIWLADSVLKWNGFGLKRNNTDRIHNGLVPYETLLQIVTLVDQNDLENDDKIREISQIILKDLDKNFETFLKSKYIASESNEDISYKVEEIKKDIREALTTSTPTEIREWIKFIKGTDKKKGFAFQNDNWADNSIQLLKAIQANGNNLEVRLPELREDFIAFKKLSRANDILNFLSNHQLLLHSLIQIHDGWREKYYHIDLTDIAPEEIHVDSELKDLRLKLPAEGLKGIIDSTQHSIDLGFMDSVKRLRYQLQDSIESERIFIEPDRNTSPKFTYFLLLSYALQLEEITESNKYSPLIIEEVKVVLGDLLYVLKQDANIAPVDSLINYYNSPMAIVSE